MVLSPRQQNPTRSMKERSLQGPLALEMPNLRSDIRNRVCQLFIFFMVFQIYFQVPQPVGKESKKGSILPGSCHAICKRWRWDPNLLLPVNAIGVIQSSHSFLEAFVHSNQ
jgi:hypothetical protein